MVQFPAMDPVSEILSYKNTVVILAKIYYFLMIFIKVQVQFRSRILNVEFRSPAKSFGSLRIWIHHIVQYSKSVIFQKKMDANVLVC
jgi:hypothetical protein